MSEPLTVARATDDDVRAAYALTGNVHKAGELLGMRGQTLHKRLVRMGVARTGPSANKWTDADDEVLRAEYLLHKDLGRVSDLAKRMGRTVQFLSRKARVLGLTDASRAKPYMAVWKNMTEPQARLMLDAFKRSGLGVGQYCARKGYDSEGFANTIKRYWPDEWELVVESKAPLQTKYRLGRSFEYRTRDDLTAKGFFVMRSPRSLSPIDLVAIRPGVVLFIQCKRSGALPPAEWNALWELADTTGTVPIMAETITGRGVTYWLLTGPKDGSKRRQPKELVDPTTILGWKRP